MWCAYFKSKQGKKLCRVKRRAGVCVISHNNFNYTIYSTGTFLSVLIYLKQTFPDLPKNIKTYLGAAGHNFCCSLCNAFVFVCFLSKIKNGFVHFKC